MKEENPAADLAAKAPIKPETSVNVEETITTTLPPQSIENEADKLPNGTEEKKDCNCKPSEPATVATKPPPPPLNPWARKEPSVHTSDATYSNSNSNCTSNNMSEDVPSHKSLAEIMKEQEVEAKLQTGKNSTKKSARSVTFGDAHIVSDVPRESEEDRMLRLAIEASLQDIVKPPGMSAAASALIATSAASAVARPAAIQEEEEMDDDMKLAIRLSMQDAAVATAAAYNIFEDEDMPPLLGEYMEEEEDRKIPAISMPAGASSDEKGFDDFKYPLSQIESSSPLPLKSTGLDEYENDPTMTTVAAATSPMFPTSTLTSAASTVSSSVSATSTASLGASTVSTMTESTSSTIAAAASMPPEGLLTPEEEEQIARAIREAEDVEMASSLRLALELQKQENQMYQRSQAEQQMARTGMSQSPYSKSAHVRMVTDTEFQGLKMASTTTVGEEELEQFGSEDFGNGNSSNGERQLWGKDDYEDHQNFYDGEIHRQNQEEPCKGDQFRINSKAPSKTWSRVDKNTIVGPNNEVRTKHDVTLKNHSNADRLLGGKADAAKKGGKVSVGDAAYNSFHRSLKNSMKRSTVKGVAAHGHGRAENMNAEKTRGGAMDGNARLLISKAINSGLISRCNGVVKEGKEAIVYHADCGSGAVEGDMFEMKNDGFDVAVKVFKRNQEFKGRGAYIDNDNRYHGQKFKNVDKREQVEQWTEKEFRNLIRANRGGVPVPSPIMYKENILFMRYLGEDGWPSPQLREIELKQGSKRWRALYCQTLVAIRKLYWCSRLVHADLSEYNILVCPMGMVENALDKSPDAKKDLQIVLIDFGQAVERNHPSALDLLRRDISHVREFFVKKDINILSTHDTEKMIVTEPEVKEEEYFDEQEEEGKEDFDEAKKSWRHFVKGWNDSREISIIEEELNNLAKMKEP